jgi:hypothetical protein
MVFWSHHAWHGGPTEIHNRAGRISYCAERIEAELSYRGLFGSTAAATATIPIKGHSLGEAGHPDCDAELAEQQKLNKSPDDIHSSRIYSDESIASSLAEYRRGNATVSDNGDLKSEYWSAFSYEDSKLVSMLFTFHTGVLGSGGPGEGLLSDAVKKFGPPTGKKVVELQNGYGARWIASYFT